MIPFIKTTNNNKNQLAHLKLRCHNIEQEFEIGALESGANRVIFVEDHIPTKQDRSLLLGRQTSK